MAKKTTRGAAQPEATPVEVTVQETTVVARSEDSMAGYLIVLSTIALVVAIILVMTELKHYGAGPLA